MFNLWSKKNMNLSQQQWSEQLKNDNNAIVIDVRTPEEFEDGYIENAVNINIFKGQGFVYLIEELDQSKNYYVYCKAGSRSEQACKVMNQLGIENTYNLVGGIMQWQGRIVV